MGSKESDTAERLTLSLSHNNVSLTARVKNLKKKCTKKYQDSTITIKITWEFDFRSKWIIVT